MCNYIERVREFRNLLGMNQSDAVHADLYQEESRELDTAITLALRADAFADCVVVMAGWCIDYPEKMQDWPRFIDDMKQRAWSYGIRLSAAFDIVHKSNMTKICTRGEVNETHKKYADMGVSVEFKEVSDGLFACYSAKDHEGDLSEFIKGKLLKSAAYKAPDWSGNEWRI